jgi:hypothetical protein
MIDLGDTVAEPGFAPRAWQSGAPAQVFGTKAPVSGSPDLERILALPRRPPPDVAEFEALVEYAAARYGRRNDRCECAAIIKARNMPPRPCITRPRPAQAWALYEMEKCGGLLGSIMVGAGKSLLDMLAALAVPNCRIAMLLVPPQLVEQLVFDYRLVREHFHVPNLLAHGRHEWSSGNYDPPLLHVFPYSLLSRPESTTIMEHLAPDLVIADESQAIREVATARTSRVLRFFAGHGDTRFCAWTGSMTEKSLSDFSHHAALALRYGSPLPLEPEVVDDWKRAIDPSDWPAPPGALLALCEPGEHVAEGFRRRLVETAGVVRVGTSGIDVEHVIEERVPPAMPIAVSSALDALRESWQRPDGEELIDALAVAKCARELACGLFYRWVFPRHESVKLIEAWLGARKAWHKELRQKLKDRTEHMDSEQLCQHAAERYWGDRPRNKDADGRDLPVWHALHWPDWRAIKREVQPETEAVRLDPYLAQDAARWGLENRGIIWYEAVAFGVWIAEISGLPMHSGGPDAGPRIAKEDGSRSIVASIKSHGTGRDGLQRIFSSVLFTQPMVSATAWEQAIGRVVRDGQRAPIVRSFVFRHTPEMRQAVDKALARALYIEQTTGALQKLRLGFRLSS